MLPDPSGCYCHVQREASSTPFAPTSHARSGSQALASASPALQRAVQEAEQEQAAGQKAREAAREAATVQPQPQQPRAAGGKAAALVAKQGKALSPAAKQPISADPGIVSPARRRAQKDVQAAEQHEADQTLAARPAGLVQPADGSATTPGWQIAEQPQQRQSPAAPSAPGVGEDPMQDPALSQQPEQPKASAAQHAERRAQRADSIGMDEDAAAILAGTEEPAATGSARRLVHAGPQQPIQVWLTIVIHQLMFWLLSVILLASDMVPAGHTRQECPEHTSMAIMALFKGLR